jgi:hypothetical protein
MIAELGLDRAEDFVYLAGENYFVELPDHLTRAERPEVTPLHPRRAGGFLFGDFGEIGAGFDLGF